MEVIDVVFSPDGNTLVSIGVWDKRICFWDVETGESLRIIKGHTDEFRSIDFSPDGKTFATGSGGENSMSMGYRIRKTHSGF